MNHNRYRVIFNRARGQWMAVCETASAQGKGCGSERDRADAPTFARAGLRCTRIALSVWLGIGLLAGTGLPGHAQIVADPAAPAGQRATVLVDSGGRPLVNIQTPSAAGVSRNTYTRFDVQSNGIVLNNARANNPWLATGEAKVILNEVKSSSPSYLGGPITVGGARAQVVVANPSGLQVDGASFVNASRVTLTTGSPVLSGGALTGLTVQKGSVDILAKGLNVKGVAYTDILSRAATLAGRVDANSSEALAITTGTQTVDYTSGQLTAATGSGAKPAIAIDTAALGSMYAGKITLLATEAGVGVRNAGTLQGHIGSGQLVVTTDGRLENTGRMDAAVTSVATVDGAIDNTGALLGRNLLMVSAGTDLNQTGTGMGQSTSTAGTVVVHAKRDVNLAANARITSNGSVTSTEGAVTSGTVSVSAGRNITMAAGSNVNAHGDLQISSDGQINTTSATVRSTTAEVGLLAAQGITLTSSTLTGDRIHVETGAAFQDTSSNITITGGQVNGVQQTAAIATGNLVVNSPGATSVRSTSGHVFLQAGKDMTLTAGSTTTAGGHLTAKAGQALNLQGSPGTTPTNGKVATINATGDVTLAGGSVSMLGSRVTAGGTLAIQAHSAGGATLTALTSANTHAQVKLSAGQDLTISAYTDGIDIQGLEATGKNVHIVGAADTRIGYAKTTAGLDNILTGSAITAREDMTIGSVGTSGVVEVKASTLKATGSAKIVGNNDVRLQTAASRRVDMENWLGLGDPDDPANDPTEAVTHTPIRTSVEAKSIGIQGANLQMQGVGIKATAGHIALNATSGSATLTTGEQQSLTDLTASGNIAIHADKAVVLATAKAQAGGNLAVTSAKEGISAIGSQINARDVLSFSSLGLQEHMFSTHEGGATSLYSQQGPIKLLLSQLTAKGSVNPAIQAVSGQLSIDAGGAFSIDGVSQLTAATDLSLVTGSGNLFITPGSTSVSWDLGQRLGTNQFRAGRDLSLITKNGTLTVVGNSGGQGNPSALVTTINTSGKLTLGGAVMDLQAAKLHSGGDINLITYSGDLLIDGLKNDFATYVPLQRVTELQNRIQAINSEIVALINDPGYQRLVAETNRLWPTYNQRCVLESGWRCTEELENEWNELENAYTPYAVPYHALTAEKTEFETYRDIINNPARGSENLGAELTGKSINITSAKGIAIHGAQINARDKVLIQSSGVLPANPQAATDEQKKPVGVSITGLSDFYEYGSKGSNHHAWALFSTPSLVSGANGVTIQAAGSNQDARLVLNDSVLRSSNGAVRLQSLGDMRLESGQEEFYSYAQRSYKAGSWYNRKRVTETQINQDVTASPVRLIGKSIELKSGSSIDAYATQFEAPQGTINLVAANALGLYAVDELNYNQLDVQKKSSFLGITYSKSKSVTSREVASQLPSHLVADRASTSSGWDTRLQGTIFETGLGGATIQAGVGANARADAQIILEGVKRTVTESKTKESNYVVWQRQLGSGSTVETMTLPKFTGPTAPVFKGPVLAQIPAGDFKTQVQTLSQQPGMAYLAELATRTDVNWQPVKLAYEQWSYKQEGLTPAGAALLAVAVAMALPANVGADMLGNALGSPLTGIPAKMADAAFMSLTAQASITFVNNKGNIGKTLSDLAKSDIAKATIAAALTAGVLEKIGALDSIKPLKNSDAFTSKLTLNLVNAGGRALTNAAINGGDLTEAFKGALLGGLVDTLHGEVASQIKDLESSYIAHKFAHAMAGCVAGAAAGGTCQDGAIGAAVGEMVAQLFEEKKPDAYASKIEWDAYDAKVLGYSKLIAGATSAYTGGNAQTAITTAETAVKNNFLTFDENQLRKQAAQACQAGNAQACTDQKRLDSLDINRDEKVRQVCSSGPTSQECRDWRDLALLARDSYGTDVRYGRNAILDFVEHGRNSDIEELQSIQHLISSTPYAYSSEWKASIAIKTLASIVVDLTPLVGDVKAFYEAKDPFDYTLAMLGTLGPAGDGVAAAIKSAKTAHLAGNANETAVQLQKAQQLAQNAINGKIFEGSGLQALVLDKNKYRITETTRGGAVITIVPDATIGSIKGTLVEFKNVINITDSSQFRGYAATGQPIFLVVSPRTETISKTVTNMIRESGGGKGEIKIFDPQTKTFSNWTKS